MNRQDLYEWITTTHKCDVIFLPEGKARCVYFKIQKPMEEPLWTHQLMKEK